MKPKILLKNPYNVKVIVINIIKDTNICTKQ